MNWMQAAVRRLAWKTLVLGACAGLWAAFLAETAFFALGALGIGTAWQTVAAGLALGGACGALVTPIGESLAHHRRRGWLAMAWGALLGLLTALAGLSAGAWWQPLFAGAGALAFPSQVAWGAFLTVLLGLSGAALGAASGLGARSRGLMLRRFKYGLAGGLAAGLPAGILHAAAVPGLWTLYAVAAAWSAAVAVAVFVTEKRAARRWLRLLTGPGEDEFFPLVDPSVHLGKLEQNSIPLLHYSEIYPVHCRLEWNRDQYRIIDDETGGPVYVNFRPVQDQPLKSGDLIKIGSALLQYGEAT